MKKIAITGSMGSGKSAFSNILRRMGYPVFDSDEYAKKVYDPKHEAYEEIVKLFNGEIVENNKIDLKKIGRLIFNNKELKSKLEAIIKPYIIKGMDEMAKKCSKYFFAEVPLLFEYGLENYFDEVIMVTCDPDIAIERCVKYRGFTREEVIKRLNNQFNVQQKIERSTYVVYNNKTLDDLLLEVKKVLEKIGE